MPDRPTGLMVVCIVCGIVGALGIVGGLLALVGAFATDGMIDMQMSMATEMPPDLRDALTEYTAEIQRIQRDRLPFHLAIGALNIVISALMLVGAIRCLKWVPAGRRMLVAACAASMAYQVVSTFAGIETQLATSDAMDRYLNAMGSLGPGGNPMAGLGSVMIAVGVVFAVAWGLLLETVYVIGFVYLRRPAIRRLFDPASAPAEVDAP